MAKEEKDQKQAEEQEKQIPEKPKKKSGGMSMPMLLGVIGAIVVFQAVLIFLLFKFFISPQPATLEGEQTKTEQSEADKQEDSKSKDWKYDEFTLDEKLVQLYETGRITTNPKSSDQFVIVDLAILYIIRDQETLEEIHAEKAEAGGSHSGEEDHSLFTHKQRIRIKGTINNILGSYTSEQLFAQRDSLPSIFKKGLSVIINNHQMKVKEVIVQEFIIQ